MSRRRVAAALALLLGCYGIHWFYLRRFGRGILYLLISSTGISIVLGVTDAIRWMLVNDADCASRYGSSTSSASRYQGWNNPPPRTVQRASFLDDSDIERLRRQWQVDVYDSHYGARLPHTADAVGDPHDPVINPATGLPMMGGIGGFDASGHTYGTGFEHDALSHWHRDDDAFNRHGEDAHNPFSDDPFKPWGE